MTNIKISLAYDGYFFDPFKVQDHTPIISSAFETLDSIVHRLVSDKQTPEVELHYLFHYPRKILDMGTPQVGSVGNPNVKIYPGSGLNDLFPILANQRGWNTTGYESLDSNSGVPFPLVEEGVQYVSIDPGLQVRGKLIARYACEKDPIEFKRNHFDRLTEIGLPLGFSQLRELDSKQLYGQFDAIGDWIKKEDLRKNGGKPFIPQFPHKT